MNVTTSTHERPSALQGPYSHAALIGAGEGASRLCNLLLLVLVSRRFGVQGMGAYALAQGASLYLLQGIDLGLRHIGARVVAAKRGQLRITVRAVQRKRILLAVCMVSLGRLYGHFGPVPEDSRTMVSLYSLSIFGYALSLDWLAWGLGRPAWLSAWRVGVSGTTLVLSAIALLVAHASLIAIAAANGISYLLAAIGLWALWARPLIRGQGSVPSSKPSSATAWGNVAWLGLALLANQALGSADLLILGGIRGSAEAGLYSAAYRLLLLITAIYYFGTQAIYPRLAAVPENHRNLAFLTPFLWRVSFIGVGVTLIAEMVRTGLILSLFGRRFVPSIALAGPLLLAIAPDFGASILMTALTAWNRSRLVLAGTAIACSFNLLLNFALIPRYGASAPAWVTPISYLLLFAILVIGLRRFPSTPAQNTVLPICL